jgi:hypothetical protein
MRVLPAILCGAVLMTACAAPGVQRGPTTAQRLGRLSGTSLVLSALGRPPDVVGVGNSASGAAKVLGAGDRRLDQAERALLVELERAQLADRVLAAADLGPRGAPQPAFLVSYRITSYVEHVEGAEPRWWVGAMLGSLTAGLGWLIAIESRVNATHTFEIEVRVFDVRGAQMLRVQERDGTFSNAYDTSVAAPLMRRTYSGTMRTWYGAGTNPGGTDLERFMSEQGDELARTMFDMSARDVAQALHRGAAESPPVRQPSPPEAIGDGGSV